MSVRECLLLVGHTGMRYREIDHMRALARERFGLPLIFVNDKLQAEDELHFEAAYAAEFATGLVRETAASLAAEFGRCYRPVGVLPFRDNGVPLAAALAERYELPGADPTRSRAGIDKAFFRLLEGSASPAPGCHHAVRATEIGSYEELVALLEASGGRLFIKPKGEANSRGCMALDHCTEEQVRAAWDEIATYRAGGILAEELVTDAREYSWDYAAGVTWLTEKGTSDGKYRAEVQQIVPAPLGSAEAALDRTGRFSRDIVCTANGAYHNELLHMPASDKVAIVEVNMRPGGMHIWELARNAFADFDPWELWLQWAVSGRTHSRALERRAYTGVRYLRAPHDGTLRHLPDMDEVAKQAGTSIVFGSYVKPVGSTVSARLKDNVQTYGYVVCEAVEHAELCEKLRVVTDAIENATVIA